MMAALYWTSFVSPAVLPKPPNLEDYDKIAPLKRKGSVTFFYFYEHSFDCITAKV
jgi:hypothetical protein